MKKRLSRKAKTAICAFAALALALIIWTVWRNSAPTVSEFKISSPRIPASFSGFRIAQISDLHNAKFGKNNDKLLKELSESEPDVIVITGDLVDSRRTNIDVSLKFIEEALKIAPVYYVTGNHESRISQYDELKNGLEAIGAITLDDKAEKLERGGKEITIVGLSDPSFTIKRDTFGEIPAMTSSKLKNLTLDDNNYKILLSHRPELFETYAKCDIDLAFCGHAHGGQFRLPFIGGLFAPNQGFFPKYDSGVYTDETTSMIVSRGIGNSIVPIRFNNRPEIILTELYNQ